MKDLGYKSATRRLLLLVAAMLAILISKGWVPVTEEAAAACETVYVPVYANPAERWGGTTLEEGAR